jgi:ABC-type phosphate transport system ATPase subunit
MNADPLSSVGAGPHEHTLREILARAVGRDAPILILDEPASAVGGHGSVPATGKAAT